MTIVTVILKNILGNFEVIRFWVSNTVHMNGGGTGELKFFDPITLEIVAEAVMPDRCSVARMSMIAVAEDPKENIVYNINEPIANGVNTVIKEELLVLLGDEFAYQYRYNPHTKTIRQVSYILLYMHVC